MFNILRRIPSSSTGDFGIPEVVCDTGSGDTGFLQMPEHYFKGGLPLCTGRQIGVKMNIVHFKSVPSVNWSLEYS